MMNQRPVRWMLSAMALAALVACGGGDDAASVACTPISSSDLASGSSMFGACIPGNASSRRYDMYLYLSEGSGNSYLSMTEVNFAPSTSCAGTVTSSPQIYTTFTQGGTTTLAAFGTDGVTSVTGTGRSITLDAGESVYQDGTFTGSVPFGLTVGEYTTTQTFALCKRAPSTTASRTVERPFGNASPTQFTPTFALSGSLANQTSIATGFALDGPSNYD